MRKNLYSASTPKPTNSAVGKQGSSLLKMAALLMLMGLWGPVVQAQFSLVCPPTITTNVDSGQCSATVNYPLPSIAGGVVLDTTFAFTGAQQFYVVPANISKVTIECWGAQGMTNTDNAGAISGGLGGYSKGELQVNPGDTLYVYVGDGGSQSVTGGYNGGGDGGDVGCNLSFGGGGGGASDVRYGGVSLNDRVIVAGGGGGAGGNRNQGCGRGTGGGGGGGWYGGGGGAAWPYQSTVLPTGGTQTAGGTAGTSSYTTVPNNDGTDGSFGQGGNGGDEAASSQGGDAAALAGGAGGGTTGGIGAYSANWTGQSGAGGSGYVGGVSNDSMATGVWAGQGQVRISFDSTFTLTLISGLASGSTFPTGTNDVTYAVQQGPNTDTCTFSVMVMDNVAPVIATCPTMDTVYVDTACSYTIPNFGPILGVSDNCDPNPSVSQTLTAGTVLSGIGTMDSLTVMAMDSSGNMDSCFFRIMLADTTAPVVMNCPATQEFTPNTLDCNPSVNFVAPSFMDNCGASVTASHQPGDTFPLGATTITYTATDSSGNSSTCTFTLTVNSPVLDNVISATGGPYCAGDTAMLMAAPGYASYMWSDNSTGTSLSATTAGVVWVDVTDTAGCTGRDSFMVMINPTPSPTVTPNGASVCVGTQWATYQWYQDTTMISGATSNCFQPTTDGNFWVVVTDSAGCEGTSDTLFFVNVKEPQPEAGFDLYPNPAQNEVVISLDQPIRQNGSILVFDLTGRLALRKDFEQLATQSTLDLSQVSAGSYILEIRSEGLNGRKRLIRVE